MSIADYLGRIKQTEKFELKRFPNVDLEKAKKSFIETCKFVEPKWSNLHKDVTQQLTYYCVGSEKFNGSLDKGLLLIGSTGVGKTVYLNALRHFIAYLNRATFRIYTGFEMERIYQMDKSSFEVGSLYSSIENKMFAIDDLGEEHATIKIYGSEVNVGVDTLTQRHQLYISKGYLTFATSNLNAEMIRKKYGNRIESRVHEMFNIIVINGKDLRKNG